jgi:hypothetical protein
MKYATIEIHSVPNHTIVSFSNLHVCRRYNILHIYRIRTWFIGKEQARLVDNVKCKEYAIVVRLVSL